MNNENGLGQLHYLILSCTNANMPNLVPTEFSGLTSSLSVSQQVPFEVACTNQMRTVLVEARSVKVQPITVDEDNNSDRCCMICMVNPINSIILPCGHQVYSMCLSFAIILWLLVPILCRHFVPRVYQESLFVL